MPQGSVLGPLLFLVYINDLVQVAESGIRLFADDTTLVVSSPEHLHSSSILNTDLQNISAWASQWLVTFSPPKTQYMCIYFCQHDAAQYPLFFEGTQLPDVTEHKHLGVTITHTLSWSSHISKVCQKTGAILNILSYLQFKLDRKTLETIYFSFVRPILEYADVVWGDCTQHDSDLLESVQKRATRIVSGGIRGTSSEVMFNELG